MLKEIKIINDNGREMTNKENLVNIRIDDNTIYPVTVEEAKRIINHIEGQIFIIEMQGKKNE